jgi:calcineurin-like phosphoesterase family protein
LWRLSFLCPQDKRVNAGAGLIEYQPIALSGISELIPEEKEKILVLS